MYVAIDIAKAEVEVVHTVGTLHLGGKGLIGIERTGSTNLHDADDRAVL